ncbi:DNA-binding protein [Halteromyces radiatus]|uniref:DNA-binding protein n=1 Tax=Halteromyces radiatus TaxID=101107 RepID=UPI00221EC9D9|nr:DNA-binding protein [Halteromyces radiatus]KAI8089156.1 DNA-binding protein [Halteromyces radiatus]
MHQQRTRVIDKNKGHTVVKCIENRRYVQVWIHQVLYHRGLYPKDVFELRKQYNVPVHMSIHPEVCQYIKHFVDTLQPVLEKNQCQLVSLVILSNTTQQPLERYVLAFDHQQQQQQQQQQQEEGDLYHDFRACLLKLNALPCFLSPPVLDCTFTLGVELNDSDDLPFLHNTEQVWIPGNVDQTTNATTWTQFVPIKTMHISPFKINMYVMEAKGKGKQIERH